MRPFPRFLVFFLGCLVMAVVLAPPVYLLVQSAAVRSDAAWLHYLAGHPFHRYFNRVLQVSLLASVWWLLKGSGFNTPAALGLKGPRPWRKLGIGVASSFLVMALYTAALFLVGWQQPRAMPEAERWVALLLRLGFTAAFVALLEELFFRGYLYGMCSREFGRALALALNLVLFPILHYFKPPHADALGAVDALSGLRLLGMGFQRLANPAEIVGGLLVLVAITWMLCRAMDRSRGIHLSIGLHAGWILALQLNTELMTLSSSWPTWVLGGGDLSQGALALVPLGIQALFLHLWFSRSHRQEA
jgi:membrane protease YdiL (CAAX protease family)